MSYALRDRPDGQVEIIFSRPILVGVFPERDTAERICAFLKDDQPELPEALPINFREAKADAAEAETSDLSDLLRAAPKPVRKAARRRQSLPVAPVRPVAPVQRSLEAPQDLTEEQVADAFARIQTGEKIPAVAMDFGMSMFQLRGMWANHKRQMQRFIADAGQQPCAHCQRPFTPSISHPDTCARCSK